jgi:hypothetical protein
MGPRAFIDCRNSKSTFSSSRAALEPSCWESGWEGAESSSSSSKGLPLEREEEEEEERRRRRRV